MKSCEFNIHKANIDDVINHFDKNPDRSFNAGISIEAKSRKGWIGLNEVTFTNYDAYTKQLCAIVWIETRMRGFARKIITRTSNEMLDYANECNVSITHNVHLLTKIAQIKLPKIYEDLGYTNTEMARYVKTYS